MINNALLLLRDELVAYIASDEGHKADDVAETIVVDNISIFETTQGDSVKDKIVITLVNIEEESALKNQSNIRKIPLSNAVYENTPVFLNLYVLITCNYTGFKQDEQAGYMFGLKRLSRVIQFLQGKTFFSYASSVSTNAVKGSAKSDDDLLNLKFTLELYTLTFEQINHLWGSLGGRQMPFVMYKLRLVAITERKPVREVPVIEEIETNISATAFFK